MLYQSRLVWKMWILIMKLMISSKKYFIWWKILVQKYWFLKKSEIKIFYGWSWNEKWQNYVNKFKHLIDKKSIFQQKLNNIKNKNRVPAHEWL